MPELQENNAGWWIFFVGLFDSAFIVHNLTLTHLDQHAEEARLSRSLGEGAGYEIAAHTSLMSSTHLLHLHSSCVPAGAHFTHSSCSCSSTSPFGSTQSLSLAKMHPVPVYTIVRRPSSCLVPAPTPSPSLTFAHVHTIANWRWRKHTLDWREREVQDEDNSIFFITILLVMPLTSHRIANPLSLCRDVGHVARDCRRLRKKPKENNSNLPFCFLRLLHLFFHSPIRDEITLKFSFLMPQSLLCCWCHPI
jgi:hypothetical protein